MTLNLMKLVDGLYARLFSRTWDLRTYDAEQDIVVEQCFRAERQRGGDYWALTKQLKIRKVLVHTASGDLVCDDAVLLETDKLGLHTEEGLRSFFMATKLRGPVSHCHGF